jgi:hypothetical protein
MVGGGMGTRTVSPITGKPLPNDKNRGNGETVIADRRRRVAHLYMAGKAQCEIAAELNCSQPTVSLDLAALQKEWLASGLRDFDAIKSEQLAKIDLVEQEALGAWRRSCEDAESRTVKVEKGRVYAKKGENEELPADDAEKLVVVKRLVERSRKGQTGNPAFLTQIQWCVETRLRLINAFEADNKGKGGQVNVINWGDMTTRPDDSAPDEIESKIAAVKQLAEPVEEAEVTEAKPPPKVSGKKGKR